MRGGDTEVNTQMIGAIVVGVEDMLIILHEKIYIFINIRRNVLCVGMSVRM